MFILNNMEITTKINQKSRERENALMGCQYLFNGVCHSMAKRPDWAVKSWTALNIKEFVLFDMFGSVWIPLQEGSDV